MAELSHSCNWMTSSAARSQSPPHPVKNFVWDEKPRYLNDLLQSCRLPFTAKIQSGNLSKFYPEWKDTEQDILQVLETRRHKVVVCKRLQRKAENYTLGSKQELPASFKGWFEVLPEEGFPVEYFDSIQAIANVKPRRFLIRTSIIGYQLSISNGVSCWAPLELQPGTVLTTGIVYMDQKKTKSNVKSFFKKILKPSKHSRKDQDLKYLQCFDSDGKEIMIPLIMTGVFSPVGEPSDSNYDAVYELQDLILAFNLPVKTQLIHEVDDKQCTVVPRGLLQLEEVVDRETVVVGRYPVCGDEDKTFEIPSNAEIVLRKDLSKKQQNQRKSLVGTDTIPDGCEQIYVNADAISEVELPRRVKETSKQKRQGLFDKLSVRSKVRKERASLKQLQAEGVFSSRLSKSEQNLEDSFKLEDDNDMTKNSGIQNGTESMDTLQNMDENPVYTYGVENNSVMQSRDLPPIPTLDKHQEKESLYEELPIAPKPPQSPTIRRSYVDETEDDGYMCPAQLRKPTSTVVTSKPPIAPPRDYTYARPRKRGDVQSSSIEYSSHRDTCPMDIDRLFNFSVESQEQSPYSVNPIYQTTANAQTKARMSYDEHRYFADDSSLAISDRDLANWTKAKSRSQKSLNVDANVTVRSHNFRKVRNVMDVFNVGDPCSNRQPQQRLSIYNPIDISGPLPMDQDPRIAIYEPEPYDRRSLYAVSEPGGMRRFQRTMSSAGLSDVYGNGRDDSAFSGDYGYHGDSEYSYNEYPVFVDDGWRPPSDLSTLSVQEVSRSLRYIGMKDRVVLRLANEQIDGQLLCSLDKKLLQEGFPELNALEIKKIIDFINGWRPKK